MVKVPRNYHVVKFPRGGGGGEYRLAHGLRERERERERALAPITSHAQIMELLEPPRSVTD